ncbi:hypothetical protein D3C78_1212780 [compost metagenome]
MHVVAAHHGAQQFGGTGLGDESHLQVTMRHGCQERCLDLGRIVHARGNAVGQQVQQECVFTSGRVLDQLDQFRHLLGLQRQGRNAKRGALSHMIAIGFQHGSLSNGFLKWGGVSLEPVTAYLLLGSGSNTLGGGFFLMASATCSCSGLMHSSARRWPSF